MAAQIDIDLAETKEWLDALDVVIEEDGVERAEYLLAHLASKLGVAPGSAKPRYKNTIAVEDEAQMPNNGELALRVSALVRWNAVAMVVNATRYAPELGGHLASYASASTLYEVGFNHFFHSATDNHGGDLVYFQGHSSPGIYARAFLEGRFSEAQLKCFRQEVEKQGLSSYPHPWLMPHFWQFPTVSMGLGPLQAIYQARFLKYMENRGLIKTEGRKVWAFCGDGEMDEPESLGAITLASRENCDNLIFVINCNLQRLDGPVRGNGSIIRELEGVFSGAGWNVIKVLWGSRWDELFARDTSGLLLKRMEEAVDGEYQNYKAHDGAYVREHFFGKYPELAALVADMTDDEIWHLNRGGHDPQKVYAAYKAATEHKGQPTVILAKTVKGFGMGTAGEGMNTTHQQKKMTSEQLLAFRDRFKIPVADDKVDEVPFYRPEEDSEEIQYIREQRKNLGGVFPIRRDKSSQVLPVPDLSAFESQLTGTGEREISTTMAFVRILNVLVKDKELGKRVVPIVPDECRTFGMEGMFRQLGIYSSQGQLYTPVDADQLMYYHEAKDGQILEEGLTEAGAFCSWMAAASSYSSNDYPMIPFYIYYSMFGFQRIGDFAWAAGDMQARGFLLGATAGRTTLAGEGLQHQDGHSHVLASTIPNCVTYDPTYNYELAVIIQDGLRRMYVDQENVYYYITVMNENYQHPPMPKGVEDGILKGMYLLQKGARGAKMRVQLLGSGTILREVLLAAEHLYRDFRIASDVWSVTSFNELRKEGQVVDRLNMLRPSAKPKVSYVTKCLAKQEGPVVAATDYTRAYADQIRAFIPQRYRVLGTDGFGRSDTREQLRHFFEVNWKYIAVAALKSLAEEGTIPASTVVDAINKYGINPKKVDPTTI